MKTGLAATAIWLALSATALAQPGGGGGMIDRLMAADANHDGAISKAEMRAARETMFRRLDANGDGFLSTDETARAEGARKGGRRSLGSDANGDGKLSRDEVVNGRYRAFDMFDANHDDVLQANEIETAQNLFAQRRNGTP